MERPVPMALPHVVPVPTPGPMVSYPYPYPWSRNSLHTFLNKYLYQMLVKFEQSRMVRTTKKRAFDRGKQ